MTGSFLGSERPIVAAPMAGGPSTTALAVAVARAGAFPFLAAGYATPERLARQIEEVRAAGSPFGVNLFVPSSGGVDGPAFRAYAKALRPEAERYGLTLDPAPVEDDDAWAEKLALLRERPVPVVSLTFGLPAGADVRALQRVGSRVLASVTTVAEARAAEALGVDGLVVQGAAAGGHSAVHDPEGPIVDRTTESVVASIRAAVALPLVAGGGVDGPEAVRRLLDSGADAVAVGTLLLRADEAGTSTTHRAALADARFTETVLTRAFTGRYARALRNAFVDRHEHEAPNGYPAVHHLTRGIRAAAAAADDVETAHLWAGTGWRSAPAHPVAEIVAWLAGERAGSDRIGEIGEPAS